MAKRKSGLVPWPEDVWYTEGKARLAGLVHDVGARLAEMKRTDRVQAVREFDPREVDPTSSAWWAYEASWCTNDGGRITARLDLTPDPHEAEHLGATAQTVADNRTIELGISWSLVAKADGPWQSAWANPVLVFLNPLTITHWNMDSIVGSASLHAMTSIGTDASADSVGRLLDELAKSTFYTTVITHDRRELGSKPHPPLCGILPNDMGGKVVELRAYGDQDQMFNEILARHRVSLRMGGAVILPHSPRKDGWPASRCSIALPGAEFEALLHATAWRLFEYAELPAHYHERAQLAADRLRAQWGLPEVEMPVAYLQAQLEEALEDVEGLTSSLADATRSLEEQEEQVKAAQAVAEQSRAEVLEMMQAYRDHPLQQRADEASAQAEEAFSGQEAAESAMEDLTAEVAWLRRRLAQAGASYAEEAPPRPSAPGSWADMFALVADLFSFVRIGDVREPLAKLIAHRHEASWRRRTWEVLEALEAYAGAKAEHGRELLPHFTAYLNWPQAPALVPLSFYAAKETTVFTRDSKYRDMRVFEVPQLGPVFMGEHFRIGGSRPPAPRMHVYDDTGGKTGMIHIGYIGPHLPNGISV
ncbi:polyhydroxyalkanoate synthesis regulator phasin [Streptomyces sp. V3I8]|uniref:hypothetical protein n=1 Tax=Streptomyces sp. V3I8 TaxID=3042279 RepID=UPI00278A0623|nr:hypothetical protein [Streptomyces sp. V3I8]MDQ1041558.1 polyhydroxyalkanoate synthesis regulator phasin [Streptomyces sp. V3I8]